MLYKQQRIVRRLPTCSYTISDLDGLIDICIRLHQECKIKFIDDIRSKKFSVTDLNLEDENQIKLHVDSNFFWMIEIHGEHGEYLNVMDLSKLAGGDLPQRIRKVSIGNLFMYEFKTTNRPSVHFDVTIDFDTIKIFDLITLPTRSTKNESAFEVTGSNSVTVLGLAAELDKFFTKHKNLNGAVNAGNAYDILLWLVFLPLSLIYLIKYQAAVPNQILSSPMPIQIIFSFIVFFQSLMLFRLLFNFARWFFPCQELKSQTKLWRQIAKYTYSAAVTGLIGTVAFNFIAWLIQSI